MLDRIRRRRRPLRRRSRGQSLVEFAIIVPLFLFLLMTLIEYSFAFNSILSADYATRDAALLAAEAGNNANADCVILSKVDEDMSPPTDRSRIQEVWIYRADDVGNPIGGSLNPWSAPTAQQYTRGGTDCGYTKAVDNWPPEDRCNILNGETCPYGQTGVDQIGVRVVYNYMPHTPVAMPFLGLVLEIRGDEFIIVKSNVMRMEPVL